jgi:uncharacterized protein with LGFP repeats
MNMKTKIIITAAAVAAAAGITACMSDSKEAEKEETISLGSVPAAVKATLAGYAADSEVKKAEKGDEDGKTEYEFEIEKGGRKFEVAIAPDGKFLDTEEDVAFNDLPEAVQKALMAQAGGGKISGCEKSVDGYRKVTYEADITKEGKKMEVALNADGQVLKTEAEGKEKD